VPQRIRRIEGRRALIAQARFSGERMAATSFAPRLEAASIEPGDTVSVRPARSTSERP
jgi:hypothetical protein